MKNQEGNNAKKVLSTEDQALLLVKGANGTKEEITQYVKKLSVAIATTFQKHNVVRLRCIGNGAIGNAKKAHAIAAGELFKKGIILADVPSFKTVSFEGEERTSIVMELKNMAEVKGQDKES